MTDLQQQTDWRAVIWSLGKQNNCCPWSINKSVPDTPTPFLRYPLLIFLESSLGYPRVHCTDTSRTDQTRAPEISQPELDQLDGLEQLRDFEQLQMLTGHLSTKGGAKVFS